MRKKLRFILVIVCLFLALSVTAPPDITETAPLRIYFLDVGQGDAILLRTLDGDVLIDAGTEGSETLLCLRLEQLGVRTLKLAIFTHFDEDHIGGADAVIRRFPAEKIWIGTGEAENEAAERLLQSAAETDAEVLQVFSGAMLELGDLFLYVMSPLTKHSGNGNEDSLIVKMRYGNVSALFMGDAGIEQEFLLVERYGKAQLSVDLCKIGHHGSNSSTSLAFLECAQPLYAVISCGADNPYGHPTGRVLADLEFFGVEVFRTDLQGEIVFVSDGEALIPVSNR